LARRRARGEILCPAGDRNSVKFRVNFELDSANVSPNTTGSLAIVRAAEAPKTSSPMLALDARWYTDPAIFEREQAAIFARTWQLACHQNQLSTPGAYATFAIGKGSLFVVRGRDETIRCFHNVCRHRARPGIAQRQVCHPCSGTARSGCRAGDRTARGSGRGLRMTTAAVSAFFLVHRVVGTGKKFAKGLFVERVG